MTCYQAYILKGGEEPFWERLKEKFKGGHVLRPRNEPIPE